MGKEGRARCASEGHEACCTPYISHPLHRFPRGGRLENSNGQSQSYIKPSQTSRLSASNVCRSFNSFFDMCTGYQISRSRYVGEQAPPETNTAKRSFQSSLNGKIDIKAYSRFSSASSKRDQSRFSVQSRREHQRTASGRRCRRWCRRMTAECLDRASSLYCAGGPQRRPASLRPYHRQTQG